MEKQILKNLEMWLSTEKTHSPVVHTTFHNYYTEKMDNRQRIRKNPCIRILCYHLVDKKTEKINGKEEFSVISMGKCPMRQFIIIIIICKTMFPLKYRSVKFQISKALV